MPDREKPLKAQPDVGKERPRERDRAEQAEKSDKSRNEEEPVQEKGGRNEGLETSDDSRT